MLRACVLLAIVTQLRCSDLGVTLGDAAISQLFRHVAAKVLQKPRVAEIILKTQESPSLGSLVHIDFLNQLTYKNLSVIFQDDSLLMVVDRFSFLSHGNISEVFWPLGPGEQTVDVGLQLHRAEFHLHAYETAFSLSDCLLFGLELVTSVPDHWVADKGISALASLIKPMLDSMLCNTIRNHFGSMEASTVILRSVEVNDYQMTALAQLEWTEITETPAISLLEDPVNTTLLEVKLKGSDLVTIWLEDGIINELLEQFDWNFEWMDEQLPVTSTVIPSDSRRDRVYLRVVNPNRNLTSVFVSFVLTIQAELRPAFDGGILRTLVQLLDTSIEMEAGAFPKTWGIFMQDLIRGMIMDMLWPEIKNAIEELSYGKGVAISQACGVDPNIVNLDIGEGSFALTTRLALQYLDLDKCLTDLKTSLPSTSKIFQKIEQ
uniref:BPI2 domain-containing protein n=1 Tax=Angiostrongylus cantonensis TaxID=6313 RepID=A0A158P910_ANGCA